jgi:hypothetical protein
MPRIFDNIEATLRPTLEQTLELSQRADFCVGYFNLRGWKELDSHIEAWAGGKENCCRLLVGMQRLPQDELRAAFSLTKGQDQLDHQTVLRLKKKLAEEFRSQLTYTVTSNVRHLNPFDIQNFPLPESALADDEMCKWGQRYLKDLDKNSTMLAREQKQTGTTETQSFKIQKSKPIIDEIDAVLAEHYGFTPEELDFIINYDIKYRLGRDTETEEK